MMIYKKLIILICLVLVAFQYISAQAPRPYWAKNAIQAPESGKYIFVYGEGNGKTQEESRKKAFADAVVKGQYELGSVTISAQDIAAIENGGLDAAMRFTNRQIKITCQTDPVIDGGLYKAFVLIQMSIDADKSARFYDLPQNWDCVDNNYIYELAQYNRQNEKLKKEREKENKRNYERERRRERRDRLWSDSYEYSNYFSFAFGNGINYGGCNLIGAQLTKRIGGICGIEPHIGVGISRKSFEAKSGSKYKAISKDSKWKFGVYSVGLNFFVYKGFYAGINYGVNELFVHDHFYDDYEQRYNTYLNYSSYSSYYSSYEEYVYYQYYDCKEDDRYDLESYKGMSFVLGFKYYGDGIYLDFGAGAKCYSETNPSFGFEKTSFTWNIGLGLLF